MADPALAPPLAAQDAAEALIARGWPITPGGPNMECGRIGDLRMSDEELIGLATQRGIQAASDQVQ